MSYLFENSSNNHYYKYKDKYLLYQNKSPFFKNQHIQNQISITKS